MALTKSEYMGHWDENLGFKCEWNEWQICTRKYNTKTDTMI